MIHSNGERNWKRRSNLKNSRNTRSSLSPWTLFSRYAEDRCVRPRARGFLVLSQPIEIHVLEIRRHLRETIARGDLAVNVDQRLAGNEPTRQHA